MSRKAKVEAPKFDPRKRYEWQVSDEFTVTGEEIDTWNRALNTILATDEFQRFLVVQRAAITMQNFLKEAVEEGLIKEAPSANQQSVLKPVTEETQEQQEEENGQIEPISAEASN